MAIENSNIDETRLENSEQKAEVEQKEAENPPVSENPSTPKQDATSSVKKKMAVGVGVAAGAVGALAVMGFKTPDEPILSPGFSGGTSYTHTPSIPEPEHFDGSQTPVAHGVNDEMRFSEAFAAARQEVGAGGVFEWKGNMYGTYYANEWNGFSDEYKQNFSSYPYNTASETADDSWVQNEPILEEDQANIGMSEDVADDLEVAVVDDIEIAIADDLEVAVVDDLEVAVADDLEVALADDLEIAEVLEVDFGQEVAFMDDGQDTFTLSDDTIAYNSGSDFMSDFDNSADISNFV